MRRTFKFNREDSLPILIAKVKGPRRERRIRLIFDTGAFMTQLTTSLIDDLGYSAGDGIHHIVAHGPSGPIDEGYSLKIDHLVVFERKFSDLLVATYDFSNLEESGIDGLLGFDVIKQLHLELNGPKGELTIF